MVQIRRRREREHGQILIIFALALVVILAFTSIVIDVGLLRTNTARLQNALDAGAIAGAQKLPANDAAMTATNGVNDTVSKFVLANYPSAKGLTITKYCYVPSAIVNSSGSVTDTATLNVYCPGFVTTAKFACNGTTCDALCGTNASPPSTTESCDMIGVSAYDTQPFSFGQFVGVPSGTINGAGGGSETTSFAANTPSTSSVPVDIVVIGDRTGSMKGPPDEDPNLISATLSLVQGQPSATPPVAPAFDPAKELVAFGMLGPSKKPTSGSCVTSADGTIGTASLPGDLARWVPVGLSGANAPAPATNQVSATDYSKIIAAVNCYGNSGTKTDLADPMIMAQEELDLYGKPSDRWGIIFETDGQANTSTSVTDNSQSGKYKGDYCWQAVLAAQQAQADASGALATTKVLGKNLTNQTSHPGGIEIYTIGFGIGVGTGDVTKCTDTSGPFANAPPSYAMVQMASPGAADNTCTATTTNTPIFYNSTTGSWQSQVAEPDYNPTTGWTVGPGTASGYNPAADHYFCVPKTGTTSSLLAGAFAQAAKYLASGSHLIQLPVKPPVITSIAPSHGSLTLPTTVVITGQYFTSAYAVTPATSYVVNSDTQITAVMPSHTAGTVNVTVTNPSGASNAVTFTYP